MEGTHCVRVWPMLISLPIECRQQRSILERALDKGTSHNYGGSGTWCLQPWDARYAPRGGCMEEEM